MKDSPTGILLTALGSPNELSEMEQYLKNIRHGRPSTPEFIEEIKSRYQLLGGRSPLLEITNRQALALQNRLDPKRQEFRVYVGMRHWDPDIPSALREAANDGIERIISLPLTPYYSKLSFQAYHDRVKEAKRELNLNLEILYAKSWHDHPTLIESFADVLETALARLREKRARNPRVLFTAHSLPERILKENDPYPNQLLETASRVANRVGLSHWNFAYQSQGGSTEPWLGPRVEEMLEIFKAKDVSYVLVAPIGFLCDHMEILYDVDIHFKGLAKEKGIELERTPSLNDHSRFIEALASIVHENAKGFARVPIRVEV